MANLHVCPPWLCFAFDNRVRAWIHDREAIVGRYISPGFRVLDLGPGMGFFTPTLTRLVGEKGSVIAIDVQEVMLERVRARVERYGHRGRLRTHLSTPQGIGLKEPFDFALAFWMLHEVSGKEAFVRELRAWIAPQGRILVVEPRLHVSGASFEHATEIFSGAGFEIVERPRVRLSRAVLLRPVST